jgi:hypothetical protein
MSYILTFPYNRSYIRFESGNEVAEDEVFVPVAGREFVKPWTKDLYSASLQDKLTFSQRSS